MKNRFSKFTLLLVCILLIASCGEENTATEFTVSSKTGAGGTISPERITITKGSTTELTVTANSGFAIDTVSGCNGTLAGDRYTTAAVTADCLVTASFTALSTNISVTGRVLDASGKSIEGVEVFNGSGVLATSDSFGVVAFSLSSSDSKSIRLRKANHTAQTVLLDVLNNKADFTGTMGVRNLPFVVSADSTFSITGQHGAKVQVAGGTLVDSQGNAITGDIKLNITPVDVSNNDQLKVFPGAYSGFDAQGVPQPIVMPYGTVEYFLSQNGEELNLAPGAVATIEIPTFVTQHPDGSPITVGQQDQVIWYLNEVSGQWIEEARGTIVASADSPTGLAVQATISHFSFWNFDVSFGGTSLDANSCRVPVILNNTPVGFGDVDVLVEFISEANQPRFSGSRILSVGRTVSIRFPGNVDFDVRAIARVVNSPALHFSASTTFNCFNSDTLMLNFIGPLSPVIQDFEVSIKPVFELAANNLYEVISNLATASWTVVGHDSLDLIEPELPVNMSLPVAQGSVDISLQPPAVPADLFSFMLTAQNSMAQVSITEPSIAYILESTPFVKQFSFSYTTGPGVQITWDIEGADTVNIGYVLNGNPVQNLTHITGQSNVTGDFSNILFNLVPGGGFGYQIVVEFINQYGSTYRTFSRGDCPPDTDLC